MASTSLHCADPVHRRGGWDPRWARHCAGFSEDGQEGENGDLGETGHEINNNAKQLANKCRLGRGSAPELRRKPDEEPRSALGGPWGLVRTWADWGDRRTRKAGRVALRMSEQGHRPQGVSWKSDAWTETQLWGASMTKSRNLGIFH